MWAIIIGVIKGDTRGLDCGLHTKVTKRRQPWHFEGPGPGFRL